MAYEMQWLKLGAYTKYTGLVTQDEFFRSLDELHQHPDFGIFRFSIRDLRDCNTELLSNQGLLRYASRFLAARMMNPRIYSAILVDDSQVWPMAHRLKELAPQMLEIFEETSEVTQWLQLMTNVPIDCLGHGRWHHAYSAGPVMAQQIFRGR
ncbi:hypothetical protein PSQ40_19455 [Curvibacter sp. HBC61]|uniref:Uncharacterized protein n=1 Tax=Curvibacter cyanobacteriorum TaxID=3026422 RepID=A0ABT5N383_9BURK|nr:hypothetical protein [Curvibacter sp. HBC61]MDD0840762.1 hypothetical protein [Curvibacter sp. HBC61]